MFTKPPSWILVVPALASCLAVPDDDRRQVPRTARAHVAAGPARSSPDRLLAVVATGVGGGLVAAGAGYSSRALDRLSMRAPAVHGGELTFAAAGNDGLTVSLRPRFGSTPKGTLEDGRVRYANVALHTDALAVADGDRAGQVLVLRAADAPTRFDYDLRLGPGIAAVKRESGTGALLFVASDGTTRLRMPEPQARDSRDRTQAVSVTLENDVLSVSVWPRPGAAFPILLAPGMETPQWKQYAFVAQPDRRSNHGVVFDEGRNVLVVFGGYAWGNGDAVPRNDIWEWSPATGKWADRTPLTSKPLPRWGAGIAYDKDRGKVVLFGGKAPSGFDLEDTWEWDGATGAWSDRTAAGAKPKARTNSAMGYDRAQKKVILFGGGTGVGDQEFAPGVGLGDTWEWDGVSGAWKDRKPVAAPGPRHSLAMAFDSARGKLVIFGGLERADLNTAAAPKNDTWEWDGMAGTWTDRTAQGNKPTPRYGHAMTADTVRNRIVLFSGHDIGSQQQPAARDDIWDWDGATGAWTERAPAAVRPSGKLFSGLAFDPGRKLTVMFGGIEAGVFDGSGGGAAGSGGSVDAGASGPRPFFGQGTRDLWDWDGTAGTWNDRAGASGAPSERSGHAMAHDPSSGKVVLFGGMDPQQGSALGDTWEWDGQTQTWALRKPAARPPARSMASMAWDPVKKTVILFGGMAPDRGPFGALNDVWEWNSAAGTWTELVPATRPSERQGAAMATDSVRGKIILYGGMNPYARIRPIPGQPYYGPYLNDIWEWDGTTGTFIDRTPPSGAAAPTPRDSAVIVHDKDRRKIVLFGGVSQFGPFPPSAAETWEWDPETGGWADRKPAKSPGARQGHGMAYDSVRRRVVMFGGSSPFMMQSGPAETWEYDGVANLWTQMAPATSPPQRRQAPLAFDPKRGATLVFGGEWEGARADTWEYNVTNLADGSSCTADLASRCASGNCVDGACCEVASCSGPCKACNVAGMAGKCVLAKPGAQVGGSCGGVQACDGAGNCKAANGQTCTAGDSCASGNCADGVCCDGACTGACTSCNLAGKAGTCSPYTRGSDPEKECPGSGEVCGGSCDGVSGCAYPSTTGACGTCGTCSGMGMCREPAVCQPDGGIVFPPPFPRDGGIAPDRPVPVDIGPPPPPGNDAGMPPPPPGRDAAPMRGDGPVVTSDAQVDGGAAADAVRPDAGPPPPPTDVRADSDPVVVVDAGMLLPPRLDAAARPVDADIAADASLDADSKLANNSGCGCRLGGSAAAGTRETSGLALGTALLAIAGVIVRRRRRGR